MNNNSNKKQIDIQSDPVIVISLGYQKLVAYNRSCLYPIKKYMNGNPLILKIRYFNSFILLNRQLNHLIVESFAIPSNFL
jgi:hypothetical protein